MEKFFLFIIIFALSSCGNAREGEGLLKESYKTRNSLNQTDCSWENAQFRHKYFDFGRYCVDKKKGTIFYVSKTKDTREILINRENGFLNKGENRKGGGWLSEWDGTYQREEWSIEGNKLIRYKCETFFLESKKCKGNVSSNVEGIKR